MISDSPGEETLRRIQLQVVYFYLLMLLAHAAHILEEIWGRFWLIGFYGLGWFLIINWILFCIPVLFLYNILQERRWAYSLSMIYAGIMILNGIGHNIATIVTGKYFDGFAGGFSGIGLLLIGSLMIQSLRRIKGKVQTGSN